jgi:hypothetical protein
VGAGATSVDVGEVIVDGDGSVKRDERWALEVVEGSTVRIWKECDETVEGDGGSEDIVTRGAESCNLCWTFESTRD